MKFEAMRNDYSIGCGRRNNQQNILFIIGNYEIKTKEYRHESYVLNGNVNQFGNTIFLLHNYSNVLGGKIHFSPKRIRIFQMK